MMLVTATKRPKTKIEKQTKRYGNKNKHMEKGSRKAMDSQKNVEENMQRIFANPI